MRIGILLLPFLLAGISFAQDTNFPAGPQYLITTQTTLFLRPIATPSLSFNAPLPPIPKLPQIGPVVRDQPYIPNEVLEGQANLFPVYYGYPELPAVFLISGNTPSELPASINETGLVNAPTTDYLREHGYGETLAQAASYSKTHARRASRVYTNEDVQPLHGSDDQ